MKLYNGDCLEVMQDIPNNSIDFILTDLPYGTTAFKWDINIPSNLMWEQIKRIRKNNTATVLFGNEPFSSYLRLSNINEYKYDWIWEKEKATGQGFSKKQPMRKNELISVFYKNQPNYDWKGKKLDKPFTRVRTISGNESFATARDNLENGKRTYVTYTHKTKHYRKNNKTYSTGKDSDWKVIDELRYPTLIKSFNVIGKKLNYLHPTQKPTELLEYLIKTYTLENETVLDFTMGSGSTGVACVNTNRDFIGIELDREYYKIAKERIDEKLYNNTN